MYTYYNLYINYNYIKIHKIVRYSAIIIASTCYDHIIFDNAFNKTCPSVFNLYVNIFYI